MTYDIGADFEERLMHEVRVYRNDESGTLWWAEDDLGFTGGRDKLSDLVALIQEWAQAEGVHDELHISLMATDSQPPRHKPIQTVTPA